MFIKNIVSKYSISKIFFFGNSVPRNSVSKELSHLIFLQVLIQIGIVLGKI